MHIWHVNIVLYSCYVFRRHLRHLQGALHQNLKLTKIDYRSNLYYITVFMHFFLSMAQQPLLGQGLRVIEVSRSHSRHTTLGRTPLDEWSARRRDLYLTKHNTHKRQTSMPPARFEPTIPVSERPQTHALDRAATGIGIHASSVSVLVSNSWLIRYRHF
jgi:hypothetical protein